MATATGKSYQCLAPSRPDGVLYYMQEKPPKSTERRFTWLERGTGLQLADNTPFYWSHLQPIFLEDRTKVKEIATFVRDNKVGLVVFDTLAKVMGGDENKVHEVHRAMRGVDVIRNEGAAVVLIHHTRKVSLNMGEEEDIDDSMRGSSALAGFYDSHLAIRPRGKNMLSLTVRSNEAAERYYSLRWAIDEQKESAALDMQELPDALSNASFVLDQALETIDPNRTYGISQLTKLWGCKTRDDAREIAEQLVADGALEMRGKKYALADIAGTGFEHTGETQ